MDAYPKIFQLGTRHTQKLFDGPVEVTEKVDGSQFAFGLIDGEIVIRSKGKIHPINAPDKLFMAAADQVVRMYTADRLEPGAVYYAEYLSRPKHNVLAYNRIPNNHLALFGVRRSGGEWVSAHSILAGYASLLCIDVAPLLFQGNAADMPTADDLLETESFLGGPRIEGFVIKNYAHELMVGDQIMPFIAGKFVSPAFREVHKQTWKGDHTAKGKWEGFCDTYAAPARWQKAVQHLNESGLLLGEPKDIGPLVKEVQRDVAEECREEIKSFLWQEFGPELLRKSIKGLPEWYKQQLAENLEA